MALNPDNEIHRKQILAGAAGRKAGHAFEQFVTNCINSVDISDWRRLDAIDISKVIHTGAPANLFLRYILTDLNIQPESLEEVNAHWLGGLATFKQGDKLLNPTGTIVKKSKSDVLLRLTLDVGITHTIGISVKTCSRPKPTNAQLFFSTASAFSRLLLNNDLEISQDAEESLKMFCGDIGFRPIDLLKSSKRIADPDRWFWEELPSKGRTELETLFSVEQNAVTKALLQKAYPGDPYPPQYVMHQTRKFEDIDFIEFGMFSIDYLLKLSKEYSGFELKPYTVNKGRFKADPAIHLAPRFGVVQMQRGGQKQHPTQLQFNLKAGYFYILDKLPK